MDQNTDMSNRLVELTADIVASHVANNAVDVADVSDLVTSVHSALAGAISDAEPEADLVPAVSVRASVKREHVTCLECGKKMKMLKRHLANEHDLTPEQYRERWNLSADHPLVAPEYAERRGELAKKIGLGRSPTQKRGRKKKSA